jgi:hypothetical protein
LEFDLAAFEDLGWWVEQDRAQAVRIIRLIREIHRDPFSGIGKPSLCDMNYAAAGRDESIRSTGLFTKSRPRRSAFSPAAIIVECSAVSWGSLRSKS